MARSELRSSFVRVIAAFVLFGVLAIGGAAQTDAELKDTTVKALTLLGDGKYLEAEPELAKLVQWMPDVANLRIMYGTALVVKSKQISDNEEAKKASALALVQFQEAKRLGSTNPEVDTMIKVLGGEVPGAPANSAPASAFEQAEIKFAQSKYDEALVLYKKALEEDPKNYAAALYSADCLMQLRDYENAEKYYQKAIAIDPTRETAYRYSATHLMKLKRYDEARDRYIEALIAEPYSENSPRGISQWAEVTGAKLGHPKVKFLEESENTPADKAPVTAPRAAYLATRAAWKKEKFAKAFPAENSYRHSLKEEADAIRSALQTAADDKDADLKQLRKMDADGVLEAFILMALADDGIARDHRRYWNDNRPAMRKYVLTYVISK